MRMAAARAKHEFHVRPRGTEACPHQPKPSLPHVVSLGVLADNVVGMRGERRQGGMLPVCQALVEIQVSIWKNGC